MSSTLTPSRPIDENDTDTDTPRDPRRPRANALTDRERDILRLVADGHSTREVAIKLSYSERTIKAGLQSVTTRLHLRNRTQAVAYAVRNGWI